MSASYFAINVTKRQYFDPFDIDEHGSNRRDVLNGISGLALAKLLIPSERLEFHLEPWIGDTLVLASDYEQHENLICLSPFEESDQFLDDIFVEKFQNITLNLIAHLCKNHDLLEYFLNHATEYYRGFVNLVHIVTHLHAPAIESGIVDRFGPDWRSQYNETLKREPLHYPLPMTEESKNSGTANILRVIEP